MATPTVTTLHGRLDVEELFGIYRYYSEAPIVSISDAQRAPLPELNWIDTVYHGLPKKQLRFSSGPGKYLAFLGRLALEKRPDLAIEIASRAGVPLKIAAEVDAMDRDYFESDIRPKIDSHNVEFIGEIGEHEKSEFLGDALALLFPIDWPEPFGLVMSEALACGIPMIARPCGSVPEILNHGVTGFVASSLDDLVLAVRKVSGIARRKCREVFETRFTADAMAANYERIYYQLTSAGRARSSRDSAGPARSELRCKAAVTSCRTESDGHPIAIEFVVFVVAALASAEIGEVANEHDGFDPLDHFETQFVLTSQP